MKAKITTHKICEVDGNIVLYMTYNYKGVDSTVSIIDLPEIPKPKVIKSYIKTAEKAINEELRKKEDSENTFKQELKKKQEELTRMREFVNSRWHDRKSVEKAIKEFKSKNVQ